MKLHISILILSLLFVILASLVHADGNATDTEVSKVGPSDISQVLNIIRMRIMNERESALGLLHDKEEQVVVTLQQLHREVEEQESVVNNVTSLVEEAEQREQQLWLRYNTDVASLDYVIHQYNASVWDSLSDVREQLRLIEKVRRLILLLQTGSATTVDDVGDHVYHSCLDISNKENGRYHLQLQSTVDKLMTTYCLFDDEQEQAWTLVWSGAQGNLAPNDMTAAVNNLPVYSSQTASSLSFSMYTGLKYWQDVSPKKKIMFLAAAPDEIGHQAHTQVECSYTMEGPQKTLTLYNCQLNKGSIDLTGLYQHSEMDLRVPNSSSDCATTHEVPFWYHHNNCYTILPFSAQHNSGRICRQNGSCENANVWVFVQ